MYIVRKEPTLVVMEVRSVKLECVIELKYMEYSFTKKWKIHQKIKN